VRNRYEAAAWPQRAPWWSTATALVPIGWLWRRSTRLLPVKASSLATVASAATLAAMLAGAGLIGYLLAQVDGGADATLERAARAAPLPADGATPEAQVAPAPNGAPPDESAPCASAPCAPRSTPTPVATEPALPMSAADPAVTPTPTAPSCADGCPSPTRAFRPATATPAATRRSTASS
jgi:hypothetical protein